MYSNAMDLAVANGDFDTVKLLHRTGIKCCSYATMDRAAEIGRLDIIRWLHAYRTEGCSSRAMAMATKGGHLDVVKWLYEVRNFKCTLESMQYAVGNGDIVMLTFLISIPVVPGFRDCDYLFCDLHRIDTMNNASNDNLVENYTSPHAMDRAVKFGQLEMVEYLDKHRIGCCSAHAVSLLSILNFCQ
ncbi:hypothetical protein THRCLA_11864 [Thraustotheca clavata]|uniref:Ankyrin repeat n=1 Tax=Thraustotheca clavata TaxID=74557 RepID=A0A1V9Y668_9STRA|nr:hypothetical protein THRCLA_11864 [Thraustotheca clavata]